MQVSRAALIPMAVVVHWVIGERTHREFFCLLAGVLVAMPTYLHLRYYYGLVALLVYQMVEDFEKCRLSLPLDI